MRFAFILLLPVLAAGAWFAHQSGMVEFGESPDAPATAKVKRADIAPVLLLSGEVAPAFQIDVKPETGGRVAEIHVSSGQQVKQGDPLLTIDPRDLLNERAGAEAEVEGARLSLEKSQGNFERARKLYQKKLLSHEEFKNLEADFKIVQNELERSLRRLQIVDDRLSKTRILAPFDGTVLEVLVSEGQVVVGAASVNSGTSLMTLANVSRLLISTHVNQLDAARISEGDELTVIAPNADGEGLQARIDRIAPLATVKNNIKGFAVTGSLGGEGHGLKPGVSVSMRVPVGFSKDVLSVPLTSVFEEGGDKVVYVLTDAGIERRKVGVGLSDSKRVEITSGLGEGEDVLTEKPASDAVVTQTS